MNVLPLSPGMPGMLGGGLIDTNGNLLGYGYGKGVANNGNIDGTGEGFSSTYEWSNGMEAGEGEGGPKFGKLP